ncbi:hypothetical protein B0I31_12632 [Saccharothrix carnea]|uniref:Uncharacterized protein n=1 Tax=Saccharothrix carnea TaxID=1280637 RepID=A0A2P8HIG6_SACCR|nr:hypothetical protein [Saccharothrix carnea]PSL46001.1 hypothetical protein B0I31_12632 [Saccharothrix carnea]
MTVPKPASHVDALDVEMIGVVPPVGLEELTEGYGQTELGACGGTCLCDDCDGGTDFGSAIA